MVLEPPIAEFGNTDRLEAQHGRRAGLELGVGLGGQQAGGLAVGADAGRLRLPSWW